ncbi:MAG TPA: sugar phosphate isomerase/epimerase [Candidatus Limnocylindrales bacterium]|nr:sugar phosphate isomerase/epimerase [Candidatus Limnocylindrales bacterium]
MKYGMNLMLWADDMHDGLVPVVDALREIGYDGVEIPVFDLDLAKWKVWSHRLDDIGLARTANHVIAAEFNPVSPDPAVQRRAFEHMQRVVDCCVEVGATVLAGPHQIALGVFSGAGPTEAEWARSVDHIRRVAEYAAPSGLVLTEEVVNRFELYLLNTMAQAIRFVDEVNQPNCLIHLDTFHANIEEKRPGDSIRSAGGRIGYVHISENDRGVPGSGHVAWDATFAALSAVGYDGWLTVESFGNALPNLAAATKIWRPLFDSPDQVAREGFAFMQAKVAEHFRPA